MAAKSAGQKPDASTPRTSLSNQNSPRQSIDAQSRPSIENADRSSPIPKDPSKETPSTRSSQDLTRKSQDVTKESVEEEQAAEDGQPKFNQNGEETNGVKPSGDAPAASPPPPTQSPAQASLSDVPESAPQPLSGNADEQQAKETAEKSEGDVAQQYQEEIHGYVERIDALEAKLQYLARETSDAARKATLAAPSGSAEKKLAEKDQQIAQLMEEGKNLASTEQKHRAILKKLRLKIVEDEKEIGSLRATKEKSDQELENLRQRAKRADELDKAHDDLQKRLEQVQRELNALRPELRSKDNVIKELRAQLQKATEQADALTAKVNGQAREQDRRRIAELEDTVATLQVEKNLVADRAKIQATELKEKAERASERARALELELKAEVQVMESKLEAMRIRAEEASSGAIGDSQAKLLRQVETLQTQYSIASGNWQGIEATLLARISNMERERDEALQRESEMRKKAREMVCVRTDVSFQIYSHSLTGYAGETPRGGVGRDQDEAPQHAGGCQVLPNPT